MQTHSSSLPFYDRHGNIITPHEKSTIRPRRGVFALARAGQRILLAWPNNTGEMPGGGIEDGETPDQAVEREWQEETGIPFALMGPHKEFRHTRGYFADHMGKNHPEEFWIYDQTFRLYDFEGTVSEQPWRNPEGDNVSWHDITALPKLPINQGHWCGMIKLIPELNEKVR